MTTSGQIPVQTPVPDPTGLSEHQDQVRLVMHVRTFYPTVLIASVPNGAAVTRSQRLRLMAEGLLPGFPDLIVCEPRNVYHGLLIEMKSTANTARVSGEQKKVHSRLLMRGYQVVTARGYKEALDLLLEYLNLPFKGAV